MRVYEYIYADAEIAPLNPFYFVQKKYVDDTIAALPAPINYAITHTTEITQSTPFADVTYFQQVTQNGSMVEQASLIFKNTPSSNIKVVASGTNNENVQFSLVDSPNISGNLTVQGNLIVNGTTTTLNTTELLIEDNIFTLNSNVTGTPTLNAGMEVNRGASPKVAIRWNETTDKWEYTNDGSTYSQFLSQNEIVNLITPTAHVYYKETLTGVDLAVGNKSINHGFNTTDVSIECYDAVTGETIYPGVKRKDVNNIEVSNIVPFPNNVVVLITKKEL